MKKTISALVAICVISCSLALPTIEQVNASNTTTEGVQQNPSLYVRIKTLEYDPTLEAQFNGESEFLIGATFEIWNPSKAVVTYYHEFSCEFQINFDYSFESYEGIEWGMVSYGGRDLDGVGCWYHEEGYPVDYEPGLTEMYRATTFKIHKPDLTALPDGHLTVKPNSLNPVDSTSYETFDSRIWSSNQTVTIQHAPVPEEWGNTFSDPPLFTSPPNPFSNPYTSGITTTVTSGMSIDQEEVQSDQLIQILFTAAFFGFILFAALTRKKRRERYSWNRNSAKEEEVRSTYTGETYSSPSEEETREPQLESNELVCNACGTQNFKGDSYCSGCGSYLG